MAHRGLLGSIHQYVTDSEELCLTLAGGRIKYKHLTGIVMLSIDGGTELLSKRRLRYRICNFVQADVAKACQLDERCREHADNIGCAAQFLPKVLTEFAQRTIDDDALREILEVARVRHDAVQSTRAAASGRRRLRYSRPGPIGAIPATDVGSSAF